MKYTCMYIVYLSWRAVGTVLSIKGGKEEKGRGGGEGNLNSK